MIVTIFDESLGAVSDLMNVILEFYKHVIKHPKDA